MKQDLKMLIAIIASEIKHELSSKKYNENEKLVYIVANTLIKYASKSQKLKE